MKFAAFLNHFITFSLQSFSDPKIPHNPPPLSALPRNASSLRSPLVVSQKGVHGPDQMLSV